MFERFTERARQVVVLAQDEARTLRHNYIGTEHILLGLLREELGLAARVLESLGVALEEVRAQVTRIVGQGDEVTTGQIPFTPNAKRVLELSLREALSLGHNYIGTEHILLGLARVSDGVAMRILRDFDADAGKIRNEVIRMLAGPGLRLLPEQPSLPPEVAEQIERVRTEKEAALEDQDFERAASLRERERELMLQATGESSSAVVTLSDKLTSPADSIGSLLPLVIAIVLAAAGFPLGLLVGWLIWG